MSLLRPVSAVGLCAVLAACAAQPPAGPSFAAMPGQNKSLEQFRADDYECRNYAFQVNANAPAAAQQGTDNAVGSAAIGTALGAAAGALIGAASGNAGAGAAIGAGAGLLGGSAVGADQAAASTYSLQAAFDAAYAQCMVTKGNRVPEGVGNRYPRAVVVPPAYGYPYAYPAPVVVAPSVGFGYGWGYRRW